MKNIFSFLFLILFLFSACRKDTDKLITIIEEDPPLVLIQSTINGRVVDETGNPISGAVVQTRDASRISDANGNFRFDLEEVKKSGDIVRAELDGYFEGATHSNFAPDGTAFTEIRLIDKGNAKMINNINGGTITKNNGLKIVIPPQAFRLPNGGIPAGEVEVYSRWIDPTDENVGAIMPGALVATDENGNPLALATYGMVSIELGDYAGQELSINPDTPLKVEMPIPESLLNDAPNEIDFWQYDLEEAQWLLKGSCSKVGSNYICNVTATGYWNCDVALPAVCLSGQVFNADSTYACYVKVVVEDLTDNFIYWGYTDSLGYFCGSVPQAAPLRITIEDHCDNVVYTDEIGPYSEDTQLEDIYLEETVSFYMINITGTLSHCLTDDIPTGHLAIRYPGNLRLFPFTGGYDIDVALKCTEFPNMEITMYSNSQNQSTITTFHNLAEDIDLGELLTCEDLDDYFNLEVDGTNFFASPTQFYLKPNTTTNWMVLEGLSSSGKFTLDLRDFQGEGQYDDNAFLNTISFGNYPILDTSSPDFTVNITSSDTNYIEGNLSGTAVDQSGLTRVISGDFRIKVSP